MIASLLAIVSFNQSPPPTYNFPVNTLSQYKVKVLFDGYIPLFGGKVGKADIDLVVKATSVLESDPRLTAVESEIVDLNALAFGAKLPLNKNNIGQFFPKATASFTKEGVVKSNSAPEVNMPVKLPGLDSQRLPEISYLPLQIDGTALGSGKPFEFDRTFNKAPMHYVVTPSAPGEGVIKMTIAVRQDTDGFEDAYGNPAEKEGAKSMLKTHLTGKGSATFNLKEGKFDLVLVETTAETTVTNIKTGKTAIRNLKTTLKILREGAKVDE